jgi:hypothetical protein
LFSIVRKVLIRKVLKRFVHFELHAAALQCGMKNVDVYFGAALQDVAGKAIWLKFI